MQSRHAPPKGWERSVLASYQMWFCQKLLKNAKNYTKIVKIWRFLWKTTSGSTKIHNFRFLAFLSNFWPKIGQKRQKNRSCGFWCYQKWISQKSPNLDYFTVIFGVFEQFLAKPHLVARQNRTISTFGWCMSEPDQLYFSRFVIWLWQELLNRF